MDRSHSSSGQLCKACRTFFRQATPAVGLDVHDAPWSVFTSQPLATYASCDLCTYFCVLMSRDELARLSVLQHSDRPPLARLFSKVTQKFWEMGGAHGDLASSFNLTGIGRSIILEVFEQLEGGQLHPLFPALDLEPDASNLSAIPEESTSTSSKATMDQLWGWLTRCQAKHDECRLLTARSPSNKRWRPTRLLDIRDPDRVTWNETTDSEGEPLLYAALSYTWGGLTSEQIPMLYKRNHSGFRRHGIKNKDFPKLFRDVAWVLSSFGINFLWIDSLCIIQDDGNDKKYELAAMNKVYKFSHITIMADAAANPCQGLFTVRNPRALNGCTFANPNPKILSGRTWSCRMAHASERLEQQSFTHKRAWVLQEQFLSPRIVHFGNGQASYTCGHGRAICESWPKGYVPSIQGFQDDRTDFLFKRYLVYKNQKVEIDHFLDTWHRIVTSYTSRDMSVQSDRLPAISALATEVQEGIYRNLRYVAGMWDKGLVYQLCWYSTAAYSGQDTRVKDDRSPSWSWASLKGAVKMPTLHSRYHKHNKITGSDPFATVLDVHVYSAQHGKFPLTSVDSGSIYLRCPVILTRHRKVMRKMGKTWRWDLIFSGDQQYSNGGPRDTTPFFHTYLDNPWEFDDVATYFVPITNEEAIAGLLVQATGRRGQFRRVGQATLDRMRILELKYCVLLLTAESVPQRLHKESYLKRHSDWEYEIELV